MLVFDAAVELSLTVGASLTVIFVGLGAGFAIAESMSARRESKSSSKEEAVLRDAVAEAV